jgi:hypothetical protein
LSQIDHSKSPILVTGAHRTGTTWVGKMLSASGEAAYISEPLNLWHRPGVMRAKVPGWYTYICTQNEAGFLPAFRQTLSYRYHALDEFRSIRSRKDAMRMGRDWQIFLMGRLKRKRPLLKDPFAVFSAPWFANRLGCRVVITVRHPAAFASSLKRLEWNFDFNDLLSQPLLMNDLLEPFREEMESVPAEDLIAQGSLLWKMVYSIVRDFGVQNPDFIIVRHEDLSLEPVKQYEALYRSLGLNFTPSAQKAVAGSSSSANPGELSTTDIHGYKLDSRASLHRWKQRLTGEEIDRIASLTAEVAARYYPEVEWG